VNRWDWMAVRAYLPAVGALLAAAISTWALSGWHDSPLLAGIAQVARWVPLVALGATVALVVAPTYRLLRWRRGEGPHCPSCGGPLGHERDGYRGRSGSYRKCYACGDNVNHRHYK
jgi:hypothetical protein